MEQIIKFDPTVQQLDKMVSLSRDIKEVDLSDDKQMELIKETRLNLRTARTTIEKQGKSMREEAVKYQKDVIAREKELIAIIEPEEKRLKALEDEAALIKVREARKELLPMRREQLLPFKVELSDEEILDMDNDQFVATLVNLQTLKNEMDRQEIEEEKKRMADAARLEQVRKDAEVTERNRIEAAQKAEEQARIDAEAERKVANERAAQKIIDDAKIEADRLVQVEKDRIARETAQAEATKREEEVREQQRLAQEEVKLQQEKYLTWAKAQGWTLENSADFKTEHVDGSIVLWKKVGVYTPEK